MIKADNGRVALKGDGLLIVLEFLTICTAIRESYYDNAKEMGITPSKPTDYEYIRTKLHKVLDLAFENKNSEELETALVEILGFNEMEEMLKEMTLGDKQC